MQAKDLRRPKGPAVEEGKSKAVQTLVSKGRGWRQMTGPRVSAAWLACQFGGSGETNEKGWCRCQCPAHDSGTLALALRDTNHGLVVKCFGPCTGPTVLRAITAFLVSGQFHSGTPSANATPSLSAVEHTTICLNSAQRLWCDAVGIADTPAERYLREQRNITITLPNADVLRFHPAAWHKDTRTSGPALLGAVVGVHDNQQAIHRIWFGPMPAGRPKLSLCSTTGGAVRLAEATDTVAITEGIETALSLMQLTNVPAWASLSTSGMRGVVIPEQIRRVLIGADNDANGAGLAAANALRDRLIGEGRAVRVLMPKVVGQDFNDVLAARGTMQ
jgi:hypothetical protein